MKVTNLCTSQASALMTSVRNDESFYASTSKQLHKAVIFVFDVESDGLLLQAVDNAAHHPVGDGMCVSTLCQRE